jgi:hypothetical protein
MPALGFLKIMISFVNTVLAILMTASSAGSQRDPCGAEGRLNGLTNSYGVLALCAACDIVPRADSVCSAVFGDEYWRTDSPPTLAERTSRASLDSALDWVRSAVRSLPADSQCSVLGALESFAVAASTLEALEGTFSVEALGAAVAFVPAVADLFPRDEKTRAALGQWVGGSLASAEYMEMKWNVARRLSRMSSREQDDCLRKLCAEALKARE